MITLRKFFLIFLLLYLPKTLYAAPKSDLWSFWQQENASNQQSIDHSAWQQILTRYLVVEGQHHLFRYANVNEGDRAKLRSYINNLASLDPRNFNKDVQFAYWVNLYNALTVNLILDNFPVGSIRKIGGLFSFGPWDNDIIEIQEQELSLNDIEHRILRPIWKDQRIHYVVNCASLGCPNLPALALTETNKEIELEKAAIAYINSPKGVLIRGNNLTLSEIYEWYAEDFGDTAQQIFSSIDKYRKGPKLSGWKGSINYDYDWDLNVK